MDYAWMLRKDGKYFPVEVHPYIDTDDDMEGNLYSTEWLYNHTDSVKVKDFIVSLYSIWFKDFESLDDIIEEVEDLSHDITVCSIDFIKEIFSKKQTVTSGTMNYFLEYLSNELNQDFCRVRFGGIYDTDKSSKELVFRISSKCFDWYNRIYEFVFNSGVPARTITIVRDTYFGDKEVFYPSRNKNVTYNKMPIEDFKNEYYGEPTIESSLYSKKIYTSKVASSIYFLLNEGHHIVELNNLPINSSRLFQKLKLMDREERKHVMNN